MFEALINHTEETLYYPKKSATSALSSITISLEFITH